jgi:hypothetical protein
MAKKGFKWAEGQYKKGFLKPGDLAELSGEDRQAFKAWWDDHKEKAPWLKEHHDRFAAFYGTPAQPMAEQAAQPTTDTTEGDTMAPGLMIDAQTIESIVTAIKSAGYELRKVSDTAPTSWDELPVLMTPEEVQAVLRISRATFFKSVKEGTIPGAIKQGGSWLISKGILRAAMENQSVS